ncbi:hypothetical protein ACJRO7_010350 [Eucalyptus globulus]|uniref:Retrotransposon gag domain-containing protein n=1 Tax=Eucalyptus globulus TaxID=34317 RepID=A0ABD3LCK7_EUCGL
MQALKMLGNRMDQQAQIQVASAAASAVATTAAANAATDANTATAAPFIRAGDPEAVTLWIQVLEKAFALLMCTEAEKVVLATYQLQGIASTWWRATQGVIFLEGVVLEWNAFVEVFNNKYFFDSARELKMVEFQRLHQGSMTVDQYEVKFAELLQYALEKVENPVNRAKRFRDGLRPKVRSPLVPLNLKNYNDLYEWAQLVERDQNE